MSSKSDSRMIALGIGRFSLLLLKIRASSPELWILRHAQALSPTTELVGVDRPAVSYPFGSIEHLLLDLRAPVQEIEDPGGGHRFGAGNGHRPRSRSSSTVGGSSAAGVPALISSVRAATREAWISLLMNPTPRPGSPAARLRRDLRASEQAASHSSQSASGTAGG